MSLHEVSLKSLPHTSPRTLKLLAGMAIHTYADLLNHIPFRYEDYSRVVQLSNIFTDTEALSALSLSQEPDQLPDSGEELLSKGKLTVIGTVSRFDSIRTRRGVTMQKVQLIDDTGSLDVVWFNQPYLRTLMKPGTKLAIGGSLKSYQGKLTFQPDEYEDITLSDASKHFGRIVPVYSQTRGLSSKTIREKIWYILSQYQNLLESPLPSDIEKTYSLVDICSAYQQTHFPENVQMLQSARHRLAFDELFTAQLSSHLIKTEWKAQTGAPRIDFTRAKPIIDTFIASLPFTLTDAQSRACTEILSDMNSDHPMNRLLQGDVGSGKTIVALIATLATHINGYSSLVMAPTEILAQQHFASFTKICERIPVENRPRVVLVTGSSKPSKDELKEATIIIGTHALISQSYESHTIGCVVVDEQHKFGVVQRAKLKEKGIHPHLLSMTATPIPRTVMLTLYGELDVTRLDEVPKGRKKIKTYLVPPSKRDSSYEWIREEIQSNKAQVFVVCPLIDESEAESMSNVKAVKGEYETIVKLFPEARVGLLHGKLKKDEKDHLLSSFSTHNLDILVATPVVEVGIDIPGATIIIIETAERFGLAQLHQLRGRVGRSDKQSHCLLFTELTHPAILDRLRMFCQTHDGFKLAEYDLNRRGAGTLYGTSQHGSHELQIASLTDTKLLEDTHEAVDQCMLTHADISKIPELEFRLRTYTTKHISRD